MEVFYTTGRLRNNCASYPRELTVQLQKDYSSFPAKLIASVTNQCYTEQLFPTMWKAAYVRFLQKV